MGNQFQGSTATSGQRTFYFLSLGKKNQTQNCAFLVLKYLAPTLFHKKRHSKSMAGLFCSVNKQTKKKCEDYFYNFCIVSVCLVCGIFFFGCCCGGCCLVFVCVCVCFVVGFWGFVCFCASSWQVELPYRGMNVLWRACAFAAAACSRLASAARFACAYWGDPDSNTLLASSPSFIAEWG